MAANAFTIPRMKVLVESLLGYAVDVANACCIYGVSELYDARLLKVRLRVSEDSLLTYNKYRTAACSL